MSVTGTYVDGDTVADVTYSLSGDTSGDPALDNGTITIEVNGTLAHVLVSNAMDAPVSRNWKGYWQRAAAWLRWL